MEKTKTIVRAWAKINLGLDVTGKREDGYHLLRSVMQSLDLHDTLEVEELPGAGTVLESDMPELPGGRDNLIVRAAEKLLSKYAPDRGVRISVKKRIPMAAGLAGGSSDAAATLRGIRDLLSLPVDDGELLEIGEELGADIPYCIVGGTALAEGIGEKLTGLPPLPDCSIVLARPEVSVSTEDIYNRLDDESGVSAPDIDAQIAALEDHDLYALASRLGNVLEEVTARMFPEIIRIKEKLLAAGALGAQMSGSGPTLFGIFDDEEKARKACGMLCEDEKGTQVILTRPRTAV